MNIIALFTILFMPIFDCKAALRIRGINAADVAIQIIYSGIHGTKSYDLAGNAESQVITVQDCESLSILAYFEGSIVASAVFEVRTALIETHGAVLAPRSVSNAIIDQCEFGQVERAFDRGLGRAMAASSESSERNEVQAL